MSMRAFPEREITNPAMDGHAQQGTDKRQRTEAIDPFKAWHILPKREPGWHKGRRPTDRMLAVLSMSCIDPVYVRPPPDAVPG